MFIGDGSVTVNTCTVSVNTCTVSVSLKVDGVSTCSTDSSKSIQWNTMNKGTLLVNTLKYFKTEDIVCRVQLRFCTLWGYEHNNYKSTLNLLLTASNTFSGF